MQKALPRFQIVIIAIASPLLLGVYKDSVLLETLQSEQKTSDILLKLLDALMQKYPIESMLYSNGPGSHMALKLTYITLKSIQILKGVPFYGYSAFEVNRNRPIKAIGNLYFIKEKETIITQKFEEQIEQKFDLPNNIQSIRLEKTGTPNYQIPAV